MASFHKVAEKCVNKAASMLPRLVGPIDTSIAFIHMPKCGGTSLHTAISQHYRASHISYLDPTASRNVAEASGIAMLPFRRSLLAYELEKKSGHRFISGHWPVDKDLVGQNAEHWSFVTILRDPVERWLSNYFFNRHRQDNRGHFGTSLDLETYLDTKDAVENGKLYLSFCHGGHMPEGDLSGPITQAIDVFSAYALIGTLDNMDAFLDGFEARWKVRPRLPQSNANPASQPERDGALTPALLRQIEDLCVPDRAIYDAVIAAN